MPLVKNTGGVGCNPKKYLSLADAGFVVNPLSYSESSGPCSSIANSGDASGPCSSIADSGDVSDSGDSMTTSTTTNRSNSKAEHRRGPKRRIRKEERAKRHNETIGKKARNDPRYRRQRAARALSHGGSLPLRGSAASATYTKCVMERDVEHREQVRTGGSAVLIKRVKDSLAKEILIDQQKYVQVVNGGLFCRLCKKNATKEHLQCRAHLAKMEEEAISNTLGGHAHSYRRFNPDLCRGCPTKKLIYQFWGDSILQLPLEAQKIHQQKGAFYIDSKLERPVPAHQGQYELGIVSYSGGGKYQHSVYIPFHDLPDTEEVAEVWQLLRTNPENQGWWPVIALDRTQIAASVWQVLLVCFYQLQSSGIVAAWWITCHDGADFRWQTDDAIPEEPSVAQDGDLNGPLQGVWAEPEDCDMHVVRNP